MGMYHSTSGKLGFEPYFQVSSFDIEKEVLKRVLIKEDELRFSEKYQELYSQDDLHSLRNVTRMIQQEALASEGITNPEGMVVLNNARFVYQHDPEMNRLTVYMREDRSRKGDLKKGFKIVDANLRALNGTSVTLLDYLSSIRANKEEKERERPIVILAGSVT